MQYRNTKTGIVIDVNSEIGGDWELLNSRISVIEAEPEQKPEDKPEKKTKKTRKK